MARKAVHARSADGGSVLTLLRRAGWIVCAGLSLFVAVALASFDRGDWPSHAVAVHHADPANLCGNAGAMIAYQTYHVAGLGAWVILAGVAAWLVVIATGRPVSHPLVRALGLLLAGASVSSLHALLAPEIGPLPPARAGLVGTAITSELVVRFSTVGTLLMLVAAIGVGAVVAFDRLALAAPRLVVGTALRMWRLRTALTAGLRQLRARPESTRGRAALVSTPRAGKKKEEEDEDEELEEEEDEDEEWEDEDEDEEEDEDDEEYEEDEEDEELDDAAEITVERPRLTPEELRAKIAKLPLTVAGATVAVARDEDIPREASFEGYLFPTLDLLEDPESNFSERIEALVREQAGLLEEALHTYGIAGEVVGIESGPTVTLYSIQLAPGTKVARISSIATDLARSLSAQNIRVVPNMVGKTSIGVEVPNLQRERVRLKELMSGGHARNMHLPMFLGKDSSGEPLVADLTRMPHMLIAGTTGSGKSVCINSILMSWLYTKRPDELKLVLVDPKMVELSQFAEIPHLMCPVVTEAARATAIMEWAVERMEERYELLREAGARDVHAYNHLGEEALYEAFKAESDEERARIPKKLPLIVFVVDELADLMMTCREVEQAIVRIAQKARAVGIHLILATQRPQANVVTGLIKSNMPCRVSFKVASGMDSRIVLDSKGAELLLGQGDMLFLTPHTSEIRRAQGTLVEDSEIRGVAKFLRTVATPTFERSLIAIRPGASAEGDLNPDERDPFFDKAVEIMIESGRGSVSLLQRRLAIGYGRASRLVDQMGRAGILGDHKGSVAREVLISIEDWRVMKEMMEAETANEEAAVTSES